MSFTLHPEFPDASGQFGGYGGRYMPETLAPALDALERTYRAVRAEPGFWAEYRAMLADYVGRPSPLLYAAAISDELGGARKLAPRMARDQTLVVCLSGRGDKDMDSVLQFTGEAR